MKVKINLLQLKHSKRRLWLGIGSILFGIILLYLNYISESKLDSLDSIASLYFIFSGSFHLYESQGISANQLIGKAYLHIDVEKIAYKPKCLKAEQLVYWDQLDYVDDKANRLHLIDKSGKRIILDLSTYSYNLVRQIRDTIAEFTDHQNVVVIKAGNKSTQ